MFQLRVLLHAHCHELETLKAIESYQRNLYSLVIDRGDDLFEEFIGILAIPKLEDTVRDQLHRKSLLRNVRTFSALLRVFACKYGESIQRQVETSDFLLLRESCEILASYKYRSINQNGQCNLRKIAHFQQASTERRELA